MCDSGPVSGPLAGRRVVTTRGDLSDDRLSALLEAAGARVLSWPTCAYPPPRDPAPLEAALARLDRFDWVVFTSARAAAAAGAVAGAAGPVGPQGGGVAAPAPRVAVVGPATARAATEAGWGVVVEGRGPGARGLAARVAATRSLAGARVLFPAASGAASTVEEEFAALGAQITRVDAYRTVIAAPPAAQVRADLTAGVDAVTFASPSAADAVDRALGGGMARALAGITVVCIGPTTRAALVRRRVAGVQVAASSTLEGMVDVLRRCFGQESRDDSRPSRGRSDGVLGRDTRLAGRPAAPHRRETQGAAARSPGTGP